MEELNVEQAARYLKIRDTSMRELAEKKCIPYQEHGEQWHFQRQDLDQWLNNAHNNLKSGGSTARQAFEKLSERWASLMQDSASRKDSDHFKRLGEEITPLLDHLVGFLQTDSHDPKQIVDDTLHTILEKRHEWATPNGPHKKFVQWICEIAIEKLFPDAQTLNMNDEQLMVMVKYAQHDPAFTILHNRHAQTAVGRCCRDGAEPETAEDIVAEACIEGLIEEKRVTYGDDRSFKPWFWKVIENRCKKTLHTEARQPVLVKVDDDKDNPLEGVEDEDENPIDNLIEDQTIELWHRVLFLSSLLAGARNARQKYKVAKAHYWENRQVRDIAARFNQSVERIEHWLSEADDLLATHGTKRQVVMDHYWAGKEPADIVAQLDTDTNEEIVQSLLSEAEQEMPTMRLRAVKAYRGGNTVEEIAEQLHKPIGTVKRWLFEARQDWRTISRS